MKNKIILLALVLAIGVFPATTLALTSSATCYPAIDCDAGQDPYGPGAQCQTEITTIASCGAPAAGFTMNFDCERGCYSTKDPVAAGCPALKIDPAIPDLPAQSAKVLHLLLTNDGLTQIWDCSKNELTELSQYWEAGTTAGQIHYSGGNVGIGTNNPTAPLEVSGRISQIGLGYSTYLGLNAGAVDDLVDNYNTAFGAYSLDRTTTAKFNSAFGANSLGNNITGGSNVAVGYAALYGNASGALNVALGANSLGSNTTGGSNAAVGYAALYGNKTGSFNVSLGRNSGRYIAGSSSTPILAPEDSVFLGYATKASADGNTNEIVIGANAEGQGSNSAVLGNDSITKTILKGDVGIGSGATAPARKLDIFQDVAADNGIQVNNINASGYSTTLYKAGTKSMLVGQAGESVNWNSTGVGTGFIQTDGNFALATPINTPRLTILSSNGNVGIGKTSPASKLDVAGQITANEIGRFYQVTLSAAVDVSTYANTVVYRTSCGGDCYTWERTLTGVASDGRTVPNPVFRSTDDGAHTPGWSVEIMCASGDTMVTWGIDGYSGSGGVTSGKAVNLGTVMALNRAYIGFAQPTWTRVGGAPPTSLNRIDTFNTFMPKIFCFSPNG